MKTQRNIIPLQKNMKISFINCFLIKYTLPKKEKEKQKKSKNEQKNKTMFGCILQKGVYKRKTHYCYYPHSLYNFDISESLKNLYYITFFLIAALSASPPYLFCNDKQKTLITLLLCLLKSVVIG